MLEYVRTVQLTTKFTLTCTIHVCIFHSRNQSELACHTLVILRTLHSSHTSSATHESDMVCCTRVRLRMLHASQTPCAACESDFACCMQVRPCVLHASQTSHAARKSDPVCCTRVRLRMLHASQNPCAARESDFACCTQVRPRVLHASQTSCAARKLVYVYYVHTYHSKMNTKHANDPNDTRLRQDTQLNSCTHSKTKHTISNTKRT